MLLRFFNSTRAGNYILFPVLAVAFWSGSLTSPLKYDYYRGENAMPLFVPLDNLLTNPLHEVLAGLFFLIIIAFVIDRINTRFAFLRIRTLLASPVFIIIVSGLTGMQTFHPVYPAAFFLLLSINRLFNAYEQRKPFSIAFDSGFLLGIGSLFYLNMGILLPSMFYGITTLSRDPRWRAPVILLSGFLIPWIFTFSYYFIVDQLPELLSIMQGNIFTRSGNIKENIPLVTFLGFLSSLVLAGSIFIIRQYDEKKISSRKYFVIFFMIFILLLGSIILVPSASKESIVLMAIPVSYLYSNMLVSIKNRFLGEMIFILFILFVIYLQFF